jgi:hypothetical protein
MASFLVALMTSYRHIKDINPTWTMEVMYRSHVRLPLHFQLADYYNSSFEQTNQQRETATLVQSQRARICDQAERLLEKVISLYDFGVSLDILIADPNLRMLLVNASKNFNAQRSVESHGAESADFGRNRWAVF